MRPIAPGVPARSLSDALQLASPWAEGYVWKDSEEEEALTAGGNSQATAATREPTEEEIVAQNNKTLAWLERRLSSVKGGFSTTQAANV